MAVPPNNQALPYTYRAGFTVDSPRYEARVTCEIQQLRRTGGHAESIARLESILGRGSTASDSFEIEQRRTSDGQTLHVSRWPARNPAHVLVYVNGIESHAGWFSEVARALADRGIAVYALDRRGSGLNTRSIGTYRQWTEDLALTVEIAKAACPGAKIHLTSLCFGAAVATAFALQHPQAADSLIYMSPGLCVRVQPTAREKLCVAFNRLSALACNIPSPVRADEMFTDSSEALWFLHRDKLRTVAPRARDFFQAGRIIRYVQRHLPKINIPGIVFLAGKDRVVDNEATRRTFVQFGRIPRIVEYPNSDHIIFFGSARERLIADVFDHVSSV